MKDSKSNLFSTAVFGLFCIAAAVVVHIYLSISINGIPLKWVLIGLLGVGSVTSFLNVYKCLKTRDGAGTQTKEEEA